MIFVVVGVIGVDGITHALGTSKRLIMKHDVLLLVDYCCSQLTSWWHSFGLVAQLKLHLLVHNAHWKVLVWMNIAIILFCSQFLCLWCAASCPILVNPLLPWVHVPFLLVLPTCTSLSWHCYIVYRHQKKIAHLHLQGSSTHL